MKKNFKKIYQKNSLKNIDKLARFHTNNTYIHTTTTSAVIEVKTANSFNLFTITKYINNNNLSNRQDRLR